MSFFARGDFNIKESWGQPKQPKPPSRQKKQSILANAARNNVFDNPPSHQILDDDLSRRILGQFKAERNMEPIVPSKSTGKQQPTQTPPPSSNKQLPPKGAGKNQDIVTSMAARLSKLQQTCTSQRQQLKDKSEALVKLKAENELLKKNQSNPENVIKQFEEIRKQNEDLKTKVQQMENFLKQYGIKWVGHKMEGKFDKEQLEKDLNQPKYNYRLPSQIDIRTVATRIEELNMNMHSQGQSSTQVYKDKDGIHKIRKAQPLAIGFFADGIAIKGYKFCPYKQKESIQILTDILDGYFPYILKSKYPNGVFMKVVDKTQIKYVDSLQGDRIGGVEDLQAKQLRPPTKQEFLEKLPKQIVQNGKIIQIREAIQKKLDGVKDNRKMTEDLFTEDQQGMLTFKTPTHSALQKGQKSQQSICTLKIRTQSGKVCMLHLQTTSKMKEVYDWMRKVADGKEFVVVGNYPKKQYSESEPLSLEELGLCPNSALHLQPRK